MSPIEHIRRNVLCLSQADFGQIAGASQGTVSKWEAGELEPDREQLARIRAAVIKGRRDWDDRWFFETPNASGAAA